jgi:YHS domain-containing protein
MSIRIKQSALAGSLALAISLGSAVAFISAPGYAYDEASTASINVDQKGVILKGYDAVAYFTKGAPVLGSQEFSASYEGSTYLFASAANRDAFQADPARYAPQFGGFCAMGAALGKKLDVDPSQFKVVDGKLYLNVNADVFKKWATDIPGNIAQANANWPGIKDKAPKAL